MIELKAVSKVYGKKKNTFSALRDVSVIIPDGASVAVVGKSGSGKSTMMHIMSGLDHATSGQVVIDGDDIVTFKPRKVDKFRSETMSFIFQSFFVQGNESCYNNVSLPLEIARVPLRRRKAMIERALAAVGLEEKKRSRARDLSGGQKQRLAIARAIVNDPKILFADEPTGNLDSVTGEAIEKLLFEYNKKQGATLIVVTHDEDLANKCDMQVHIKDGQIASINTRQEITNQTQPLTTRPLSRGKVML